MKKYLFLVLILQGCSTTIDFGLGDVRTFNSIPLKAELTDVLKSPETYDGKKITVSGNIFIWSEISVLCSEDESDGYSEEKCLALSFAESMYQKSKTKDGRSVERVKGNHSQKYVSATGYFRKTKPLTAEKEREILDEYPLAPISNRHRLDYIYRISNVKRKI